MELTQKQLKEQFYYSPETGEFIRLKSVGKARAGEKAGYLTDRGWLRVKINGRHYKLHRLAFLYMEGEFPEGLVDHMNNVRTDNRWCNLRKATRSQSSVNRVTGGNSLTGYRGVVPCGKGFKGKITSDGKAHTSKKFKSAEEAHKWYCRMAERLHGEFCNFK